ncbi:HIT-like protein [Daedalea quercina L-15889]|uniref:Bis(5'-adenosyl)-triphosphatase n=1 Tax=Daedalea quercina L-15889 TaxID=1314783 RepID=A0A165UIM2_9APHY|nr:HIT-like protein [Daedalea quercina L-15889]
MSKLFFSTFEVTRQVFYCSSLTYAIVNLKPIVPGHVLIIPTRPVQRLSELNAKELASLMYSVNHVGKVIQKAYAADGLTIACQDGKAAGQTVPHVHFHLLPRRLLGDRFANNDDIYPAIEKAEGGLPEEVRTVQAAEPLKVDADEDRKPRTVEEMEREAEWLREIFAKYKDEEQQAD